MTNYNFYFVRHGYSCSNYFLDKTIDNILNLDFISAYKYYQKKIEKDPHLTKYGIIKSLENSDLLNHINFDYKFVSPLIRTFETASLMFRNINDKPFIIGPYLKETLIFDFLLGNDDLVDSYETLMERIDNFKKYINKLNIDSKTKKEILKQEIIKLEEYDEKYINNGNLSKFIEWFINLNYTNNKNILVVCHNNLIKSFMKQYDNELYENNIHIFKNNNYIIKVCANTNENYNIFINNIEIIFDGVPVIL